MKKYIMFVVSVVLMSGLVLIPPTQASTTDFLVTDGSDASGNTSASFNPSELTKLSASDDSRIQSNGHWPTAGGYDEDHYIEFIFQPDLPSNAVVDSMSVTHEYYSISRLTAAKLELWDGSNFQDQILSLPPSTGTDGEISQTIDLTSLINTPEKVNGFKARFLAYRDTNVGNNKTSHDLIKLSVAYHLPHLSLEIISQPQNQTADSGATATFSVVAAGDPTLTYQWQKNGVDIPGATNDTYQTLPIDFLDHGTKYRVIVSNESGSVTSDEATLTTYTLFSGIADGGWGTITRDPVLTDRASYADGTIITLTATPKGECNQFDHWIIGPGVSDISTTTNPVSVTISATGPRAVAAHFVGDCTVNPDHTDEVIPPPTPSSSGGGHSSGGGQRILPPAVGQVLGASTSAVSSTACTPFLNEYIKAGKKNNVIEVTKLQIFLNAFLKAGLPLTGIYNSQTQAAVNRFQVKYWQQVLLPWVTHGLPTSTTPTGYVYKTTKHQINNLMCATLNLPLPNLP